ncbi:AAA family ATPase [Clostridium algidicarnis]|uniref:AAA family ATPase n=1 Tax=Clostridium algidicarnis TaxID=37659 RepID=UPI001C0CD133|nr:AAA family ATPase [Clostridium algidicarnis]MBU3252442.1 AAA family ATPase [Clostridium algidicarnis]
MIEKIEIHKVATYNNPVKILPKKLNFIYGSNGSGKTTISNLIGNYTNSEDCSVELRVSDTSKILVYNKLFVEENFSQAVKGIFTLGEDTIQAQEELKNLQQASQDKLAMITTKTQTMQSFETEQRNKRGSTSDNFWKIQQDIGNSFSEALVGYRNSKEKFFSKCLSIYAVWDKETVETLEKIKGKYDISYSKESQIYSTFAPLEIFEISNIENSDLLQKVITGSNDTPVGQFIEMLKNSDWIRQGLTYSNVSEGKCPFCQQDFSSELQKEIEEYFDKEYENDCEGIKRFATKYNDYFNNISDRILQIINSENPIIKTDKLSTDYKLFINQLKLNSEELKKKLESPSTKVKINTFEELLKKMNETIETFNEEIINNNEIVKNQEQEQKKCSDSLWIYIVSQMKNNLEDYHSFHNGKAKAITSISSQISSLKIEIENNQKSIESIEDSLTSVVPTVTEINKILTKFDFHGFHLKENTQQKGTYLILREDGTNAKTTLSEGEYNFITFLYFYYLVYGSQDKIGVTTDKIIVIDDPISSLDSNVLFIVSNLVKNLINDCRSNNHGIKQTFILTHNVYFHKEITFLGSRKQFSKDEALFGIVRKKNNVSNFQTYEENPIESTYQLMWRELKVENISSLTSFNAMRRILEYYFKIIGDMDYEKCINEFDGTDKIICKSLVSCINDGSHFISDDFVVVFDEESIENYQRIFQLIFERLGHIQHYNMMMGVN